LFGKSPGIYGFGYYPGAARGHGGVNVLAFRFFVVTLKALGGVGVLVQRDRMNRGGGARREQRSQENANPGARTRRVAPAAVAGRFAEPDARKEQAHYVLRRMPFAR